MAEGRPLSAEIKEALMACQELRAAATVSPFGPLAEIDRHIADIERLLNTILRAIAS